MPKSNLNPIILLANGFGLGWSPFASGTVGTIPGLIIVAAMVPLSLNWQIAIATGLALLAIPICEIGENHFDRKDDGRIVADEYLTFPICTLGLPWISHPWLLLVAFLTNRVMDIIKPPPARQAQNLHGGLGIVIDDVISSFYALLLNHAIWWGARYAMEIGSNG
jgi:phosphatidylglycerophosphatase A